MAGARHNINIDVGATFTMALRPAQQVTEGGEITPLDLTGYAAKMYVRDGKRRFLNTYALTIDADDYIQVALTPAQTGEYRAHVHYYYVVDLTNPSGEIERLIEGQLIPSASYGAAE